jgi:hypothetical protein
MSQGRTCQSLCTFSANGSTLAGQQLTVWALALRREAQFGQAGGPTKVLRWAALLRLRLLRRQPGGAAPLPQVKRIGGPAGARRPHRPWQLAAVQAGALRRQGLRRLQSLQLNPKPKPSALGTSHISGRVRRTETSGKQGCRGQADLRSRLRLRRHAAGGVGGATAAAVVRNPGLAPLLSQCLHVAVHRLCAAVVQDRNCAHLLAAAKHLRARK